ncbi:hypothetical protein DBR06_SOUSAS1010040, partial [Sousa chinensis]
MGWNVTLGCGPVPRCLYLFWYQQTPGKGMGFLMSIHNKVSSEKADFLKDHFSAEMPDDVCLTLKTQPAQLGDSALQQQETLRCSPVSGHPSVSWYQQALGQGHQFPAEYHRGEEGGEGNILDRFSGHQFSDSSSEPDLSSLELTEAALISFSFSTGPGNAGVTQDPKFRVLRTGQSTTLKCAQDLDHYYMYWYRQDLGHGLRLIHYSTDTGNINKGDTLGQGPELLIYFQNKAAPEASGMPNDWVSAERPEGSYSHLNIQPVEPGDSAVYLCASSLVKQRHTVASFLFTDLILLSP